MPTKKIFWVLNHCRKWLRIIVSLIASLGFLESFKNKSFCKKRECLGNKRKKILVKTLKFDIFHRIELSFLPRLPCNTWWLLLIWYVISSISTECICFSLASLKHLHFNSCHYSMWIKEAKKLLSHKALKGAWLTWIHYAVFVRKQNGSKIALGIASQAVIYYKTLFNSDIKCLQNNFSYQLSK